MIASLRQFLGRCPVVLDEKDRDWQIAGALQRQGMVRLEWIATRVARVWATEAGKNELQKVESS